MTPEEKAACDQLHEAILAVRRVHGYEDAFLVTDWAVLIAETKFDEDGEQIHAYTRLYRDGVMPEYRVLGLLETHRVGLTRSMFENSRDR